MTPQETFDKVAAHLMTQRKKSMGTCRDSEGCKYRSDIGGLSCAAGCLIPDEDYTPEFENGFVLAHVPFLDDATSRITKYFYDKGFSIGLISKLQGIHDMAPTTEWRSKLISLAKAERLSPDILKSFAPITAEEGS